jgi:1-propanol dehydrogenase
VVSVPPQITQHRHGRADPCTGGGFRRTSDFTDALAEKAAKLVFQYLPTAVEKGDCVATRGKMHNASTLAGMAFSWPGNNHSRPSLAGSFTCRMAWQTRCC